VTEPRNVVTAGVDGDPGVLLLHAADSIETQTHNAMHRIVM
jgi:hypothetical protein